MTTNSSGKLNMGGVDGIKSIIQVPAAERSEAQTRYLDACLTALAHQPTRWYSYQDWGVGGPVEYLAKRGIEFVPRPDARPQQRSWYDGCRCSRKHWKEAPAQPDFELDLGKADIVAWRAKARNEWRDYANQRTPEFMTVAIEIHKYWNKERQGLMTPDEFHAFGGLEAYTANPPPSLSI